MSVGSLSPTALIFRAPHRSGDPVVDARSFLCRNGHGLRAAIRSLPVQEPPQTPLHQPAFPACVPKRGTGFFCFVHPRTGELFLRSYSLRPCSDTAGCLALRHVLHAWLPPSCGPSGHNHCIPLRPRLPCPVSRPVRRQGTPQARCPKNGACHKQPDKRVWEGWSWPDAGPQDRSHQERRYSEKKGQGVQQALSPACPPARKRHEFL